MPFRRYHICSSGRWSINTSAGEGFWAEPFIVHMLNRLPICLVRLHTASAICCMYPPLQNVVFATTLDPYDESLMKPLQSALFMSAFFLLSFLSSRLDDSEAEPIHTKDNKRIADHVFGPKNAITPNCNATSKVTLTRHHLRRTATDKSESIRIKCTNEYSKCMGVKGGEVTHIISQQQRRMCMKVQHAEYHTIWTHSRTTP